MLDNVGVGRVQWGIPKGYPHPPLPPQGGEGGDPIVGQVFFIVKRKKSCGV
jgi:hypothetical protein